MTIETGALGHWLPHSLLATATLVSSLSKAATHLLDSAAKAIVTASHKNILCSSQPIMEPSSAIVNSHTYCIAGKNWQLGPILPSQNILADLNLVIRHRTIVDVC